MKRLLVQEFLATKTFGALKQEHSVEVSFHASGYKCALNYDQITVKDEDPLSQECRGLILATVDGRSLNSQAKMENGRLNFDDVVMGETIVLNYSFRRFFNSGMVCAAEIDWNHPHLTIHEKLDGTLIQCYFDTISRQWCVATRSVPEADLPCAGGLTFRQLFEKALTNHLKLSWQDFTAKLDPNLSYAFELTTPYNAIVVQHSESRIHFLTARDIRTHQELHHNDPQFDWFPKPVSYSVATLEDVLSFVNSRPARENEGVVVKQGFLHSNGSYDRVKIKSNEYTLAHRLVSSVGVSERNQLEVILEGKEDDVVGLLPPELAEKLTEMKGQYAAWLKKQEQIFQQVKAEALAKDGTRKTFAILAKAAAPTYVHPLFYLYDGKTVKEYVRSGFKQGCWAAPFLDNLLREIRKE
jgi:hypothetical protein